MSSYWNPGPDGRYTVGGRTGVRRIPESQRKPWVQSSNPRYQNSQSNGDNRSSGNSGNSDSRSYDTLPRYDGKPPSYEETTGADRAGRGVLSREMDMEGWWMGDGLR